MDNDPTRRDTVGLCADCKHLHLVRSDRGAVFYQCQRSTLDPSFPRYPILPVLVCRGYEIRQDDPAQGPRESS